VPITGFSAVMSILLPIPALLGHGKPAVAARTVIVVAILALPETDHHVITGSGQASSSRCQLFRTRAVVGQHEDAASSPT
jgi:hypothetical protein